MRSHPKEVIDFLDQHWCETVWQRYVGEAPANECSIDRLRKLREAYLSELAQMSPEQIASAAHNAMEEQDLKRPFHQFGTEADYEYYGRCSFLKKNELVPLSLGKAPAVVTWEMVRPYLGISAFAYEYAKRMDLVDRAIAWQELPEFSTPLEFLTWAHKYKLPVPEAFINSTFARGEPIQYWHDLCSELNGTIIATQTALEETRAELTALQAQNERLEQQTLEEWLEAQDQIDHLRNTHEAEVMSLRESLAQAESQNAALSEQIDAQRSELSKDSGLATMERKSLLTIAIAAAIGGFGYDPQGKKNKATEEIASEAQQLGLKMTDETVLKYLRQASTLEGFVNPDMRRGIPKSAKRKPKSETS